MEAPGGVWPTPEKCGLNFSSLTPLLGQAGRSGLSTGLLVGESLYVKGIGKCSVAGGGFLEIMPK